MTAVIPTVTVLLDDGTGTYPLDISSRVNLAAGVSVSAHGRTEEFSQAVAASLSCTLKNDDAAFTTATGFGGGGFGGGGFGGSVPLVPGRRIRYKQTFGSTTVNRFTGRISEAALGFSATGKASAVTITAVDALSEIARRSQPLDSVVQEILTDLPAAYYPLSEPAGSTKGSDTSGNAQPALVGVNGPAFGSSLGTPDSATGAALTGANVGGQILQSVGGSWTSSSIRINMIYERLAGDIAPASTAQVMRLVNSSTGLNLTMSGFGVLSAGSASTGSTNVGTHVVGLNITSSSTDLWFDGVKLATGSGVTTTWNNSQIVLGDDRGILAPASILRLGKFVIGPAISDARMTVEQNAMIHGFAGETTAARFTRVAGYAGFTTSTPSNSGQIMPAETAPTTVLDALQAIADAEGGVMFANGSGTLVLQGRYYRALKTTPTLTLASKDIDVGTTIPLDDLQLVNQVTVTTPDGTVQTVTNATSYAAAGLYGTSLDLELDPASGLAAAQWLLSKHATSVPRIGSAVVKILTSSQAEQIIQAEVGDRWALTGMPSQQWATFGDLTLEGWSETLTVSGSSADWSMTANLLPFSLFQAGVWDDTASLWDVAVWGC